MENVDKTIDAICDWIQKETKEDSTISKVDVSVMVCALAELVKARAHYN